MSYPVYTIGGGDLLEDLFNGVAAIVSGSAYEQAIIITTTLGSLWLTFSYAFNVTTLKNSAVWFAGSLIAANALLVPKTTVVIIDRLNPLVPRVVDNVPFMLGTFASYTSQFGQNLTEMAEEVFSLPDDMRYSQSGFLFGGELMDSITRLEVGDPLLAVNLQEFMGTCVLMELSYGRFTYSDILESSDLFALFDEKSLSNLRSMNYVERSGSSQVYNIYTCVDAYQMIKVEMNSSENQESYLTKILDKVNKSYVAVGDDDVPYKTKASEVMQSFLPISYEYYTDEAKSALEIMNQQVAINSIYNAANSFGDSYLDARTRLQTTNTFNAMGQQARDWLPIIRVIFEAIFYGMFPFIFLAFLLPNGFSVFKNYTLGFVWLQSWGPMYAVIHRAATGMQQSRIAAITDGEGVNAVTQAGVVEIVNSVSATAGYVTMMVPYLSLILMRGIASAGHLATSMMAVPQQAASDAALEKTTGNISLGNSNINNHQMDTTYANKHDVAFSDFRYGETFQRADGSTVTQYGEKTVVDNKGAISNVGFDVSRSFNISDAYSNASERMHTLAKEQANSSMTSYSKAFDEIFSSSEFTNKIDSSSESFNYNELTREEKALSTIESAAEELAEKHGITKSTSASLIATAGAGFDIVGFKASIEGKEAFESIDTNEIEEIHRMSNTKQMQDALSTVNESIKNDSYTLTDDKGNSVTDEVRHNYSEGTTQMSSASRSFTQADTFSEKAETTKSTGYHLNVDLSQELMDYAKKIGHGTNKASLEQLAQTDGFIEHASYKILDAKKEEFKGVTAVDLEKSYHKESYVDPSKLGREQMQQARDTTHDERNIRHYAVDKSSLEEEVSGKISGAKLNLKNPEVGNKNFEKEIKENLSTEGAVMNMIKDNKVSTDVLVEDNTNKHSPTESQEPTIIVAESEMKTELGRDDKKQDS